MSEKNQKKTGFSEANCYRYLLGQMTEDERLEFDDLCFGDDDYIEQLESFREEIIDRYLKLELTQEQNRAFENYFLTNPYHLEKYEFSQRLLTVLTEPEQPSTSSAIPFLSLGQIDSSDQSQNAQDAPDSNLEPTNPLAKESSSQQFLPSLLSSLTQSPKYLIMLVLLVALGALAIIVFRQSSSKPDITFNPNNQNNEAQNQYEPADLTNNSNLERNSNLSNTLEENSNLSNTKKTPPVNNANGKEKNNPKTNKNVSITNDQPNIPLPEKKPESNQKPTQSEPVLGVSIPFLPLPGGGIRSPGEKEAVLTINRKTPSLIRFQISAPKDNSVTYLLIIKNPEVGEIWQSGNLKIKSGAENLLFSVPKEKLSAGDYILGIYETNDLTFPVQTYSFRVKKQD